MDPITIVMFALIAVLIIFMFRNGKKRQRAMQDMQNGMRPGAEVMLQSGIFGTIEDIDEEDNKVTIRSGSSTLIVHRNAVSQITTPVDAPDEDAAPESLAPDDDPEFRSQFDAPASDASSDAATSDDADTSAESNGDESGDPQAPKA